MLKCCFLYHLKSCHCPLNQVWLDFSENYLPEQFFFFFLLAWEGNFTTISTYGTEFHANEVCQQCDNLNVFKHKQKRRMHKLVVLDYCCFQNPVSFTDFKMKEKNNNKVVPEKKKDYTFNKIFQLNDTISKSTCVMNIAFLLKKQTNLETIKQS